MSSSLEIGEMTVGGRVWIAPMTGVSDLPFRRAASRLGAAYVATEMVACAEFARARPDVVRRAVIGDGHPLMVVQLVGAEPEMIARGVLGGRLGAMHSDARAPDTGVTRRGRTRSHRRGPCSRTAASRSPTASGCAPGPRSPTERSASCASASCSMSPAS